MAQVIHPPNPTVQHLVAAAKHYQDAALTVHNAPQVAASLRRMAETSDRDGDHTAAESYREVAHEHETDPLFEAGYTVRPENGWPWPAAMWQPDRTASGNLAIARALLAKAEHAAGLAEDQSAAATAGEVRS